jgi:hypothetical protein
VVDLQDERNPVCVLARDSAEDSKRRRHSIAAPFNGELHDILGVEVDRIGRERCARGVLDALIDRQDRHIAGAGGAAVMKSDCSAPSTRGGRSLAAKIRSTKSGPAVQHVLGIVLH